MVAILQVVDTKNNKQKSQRILSNKLSVGLKNFLDLAMMDRKHGIWELDLEKNTLYLSQEMKDIIGYSEEDLELKLSESEFICKNIMHPDDLARITKNSPDKKGSQFYQYTSRVQHKKAHWIWMQTTVKKIFDENKEVISLIGYSENITKHKEEQEKYKKEHQYLESIINTIDDPIIVINKDYSVELMNKALYNNVDKNMIIKKGKDDLKCYELSHNKTKPCRGGDTPCPLSQVLNTNKKYKVVHNYVDGKGIKKYVELLASPLIDDHGKCVGIVESSRDITEHLKTQDELREQKNTLNYQAHHDSLTDLPNRTFFNHKLLSSIDKAKNNNEQFALFFIDLDRFKPINDSLGHEVGDEVLKVVADRLRSVVRNEDGVARLGGDEFTVIMQGLRKVEHASVLSQKILEILSKPISIMEHDLYVSSSIGISLYPRDDIDGKNLLKYADAAMYRAKEEGRNNFQYYNTEMTKQAFEHVVMEANLRQAIKDGEFTVYYQPQINAQENTIIGMEALIRWNHPNIGLVSPARFLPLAEETGLIITIDQWVMKTAMKQITDWYDKGYDPGMLALNLAMKQLNQKGFIDIVKKSVKETGCQENWVEFEITEGQIMTNPENAIAVLKEISDMGIELAVDDFGTGYSSLSYLKRLPIDKLKIDQSFIRALPEDEEDIGITKAVIVLSKSLNLKVIAEGVETAEQKEFLLENGCHNIQGYYYGKPMPKDEMEEFLKNFNK